MTTEIKSTCQIVALHVIGSLMCYRMIVIYQLDTSNAKFTQQCIDILTKGVYCEMYTVEYIKTRTRKAKTKRNYNTQNIEI